VPAAPASAPATMNAGSGSSAVQPIKPRVSTEIITAAPPPSVAVVPTTPAAPALAKKPAPVEPPLSD
jgi:hypothetical protein